MNIVNKEIYHFQYILDILNTLSLSLKIFCSSNGVETDRLLNTIGEDSIPMYVLCLHVNFLIQACAMGNLERVQDLIQQGVVSWVLGI